MSDASSSKQTAKKATASRTPVTAADTMSQQQPQQTQTTVPPSSDITAKVRIADPERFAVLPDGRIAEIVVERDFSEAVERGKAKATAAAEKTGPVIRTVGRGVRTGVATVLVDGPAHLGTLVGKGTRAGVLALAKGHKQRTTKRVARYMARQLAKEQGDALANAALRIHEQSQQTS